MNELELSNTQSIVFTLLLLGLLLYLNRRDRKKVPKSSEKVHRRLKRLARI